MAHDYAESPRGLGQVEGPPWLSTPHNRALGIITHIDRLAVGQDSLRRREQQHRSAREADRDASGKLHLDLPTWSVVLGLRRWDQLDEATAGA